MLSKNSIKWDGFVADGRTLKRHRKLKFPWQAGESSDCLQSASLKIKIFQKNVLLKDGE